MRVIRIDGPIGQGPGEISARWVRSQLPADGSPIATISRLIDQETFFDAEASVSLGIVNRINRTLHCLQSRHVCHRESWHESNRLHLVHRLQRGGERPLM
jgi:hypothetical protein